MVVYDMLLFLRDWIQYLILCRCLSLFFSRFSFDTSLEIPNISLLLLLLYCSTFPCFSSKVTQVMSRVLILEKTIIWLLIFPFSLMGLFTEVDNCDISSHNFFMVASTVTFPFRYSMLLTRSFSSLHWSDHKPGILQTPKQ